MTGDIRDRLEGVIKRHHAIGPDKLKAFDEAMEAIAKNGSFTSAAEWLAVVEVVSNQPLPQENITEAIEMGYVLGMIHNPRESAEQAS